MIYHDEGKPYLRAVSDNDDIYIVPAQWMDKAYAVVPEVKEAIDDALYVNVDPTSRSLCLESMPALTEGKETNFALSTIVLAKSEEYHVYAEDLMNIAKQIAKLNFLALREAVVNKIRSADDTMKEEYNYPFHVAEDFIYDCIKQKSFMHLKIQAMNE